MKRKSVFIISLVFSIFGIYPCLGAHFQVTQLTSNDYDDYDVVLDDTLVVWTSFDGSDNEIYYWDGTNVEQLTDNSVDDNSPHVRDGNIIWISGSSTDAEVSFWNGVSTSVLTNNSVEEFAPRTSNGQAVWCVRDSADPADTDIVFWNGSAEVILTDDTTFNEEPDINTGWVAWSHWNGAETKYDLHVWDGSSEQVITQGLMMGRHPRFDNHNVSFFGFPQGLYSDDVYYWDGSTITNVSDNLWNDMNQAVSNGAVTWMGADNAGWQIWLWANGTKTKLTTFWNPSVDPDIDSGQVVFSTQNANYDYEIMYFDGSGTTNVSNRDGWDEKPQIKNNRVVWQGFDGNDKEIFVGVRTPATINAWHLPANEEPPTVTMRNPLHPSDIDVTFYIYAGAYPMGTVYSGTLYYRLSTASVWSESTFNWDSNTEPNEYWMASFENSYSAEDVVQYYIKLTNPNYDITYVYGSDSISLTTSDEATAQGSPFALTIRENTTLTPTPTPTSVPTLMNIWHIPVNEEPPTVSMRNPLNPSPVDETIFTYLGGYPQGLIHEGTLYFRKNNASSWNISTFNWDSNQAVNEYWMASFSNLLNVSDVLEYFIEAHNPGYSATYVYGTDSSFNTTASRDQAASNPFQYTVPDATPAPTSTPSTQTNPLPNVWHIPTNEEPPSVTMRVPLDVDVETENIYIYAGAYPLHTLYSGILYYKSSSDTIWNQSEFHWDSNNPPNEYWMASFSNLFAGGQTVEYYIELYNPSYDPTFLYDGSQITTVRSVAQADPYTFSITGSVPALTPVGIFLIICLMSGFFIRKRSA